jgi:hypothetical protein
MARRAAPKAGDQRRSGTPKRPQTLKKSRAHKRPIRSTQKAATEGVMLARGRIKRVGVHGRVRYETDKEYMKRLERTPVGNMDDQEFYDFEGPMSGEQLDRINLPEDEDMRRLLREFDRKLEQDSVKRDKLIKQHQNKRADEEKQQRKKR